MILLEVAIGGGSRGFRFARKEPNKTSRYDDFMYVCNDTIKKIFLNSSQHVPWFYDYIVNNETYLQNLFVRDMY